jgi:hypothetical protein
MPQMTLAFLASRAAQGGGVVEGWGALGRGVFGRLGGTSNRIRTGGRVLWSTMVLGNLKLS